MQRKKSGKVTAICFGDSNAYGYDLCSYLGGRYDPNSWWVDILAAKIGWDSRDLGQSGREISTAVPDFFADANLLIIMLGTNDLPQGRSSEQTAVRLERFLSGIPWGAKTHVNPSKTASPIQRIHGTHPRVRPVTIFFQFALTASPASP